MRLTADECLDAGITEHLRAAGHDVAAIAEDAPGLRDEAVLERAARDGRLLVTEDTGFGGLAVRSGRPCAGVVLLRDPAMTAEAAAKRLLALIEREGKTLHESFAVIDRNRTRIRPLR